MSAPSVISALNAPLLAPAAVRVAVSCTLERVNGTGPSVSVHGGWSAIAAAMEYEPSLFRSICSALTVKGVDAAGRPIFWISVPTGRVTPSTSWALADSAGSARAVSNETPKKLSMPASSTETARVAAKGVVTVKLAIRLPIVKPGSTVVLTPGRPTVTPSVVSAKPAPNESEMPSRERLLSVWSAFWTSAGSCAARSLPPVASTRWASVPTETPWKLPNTVRLCGDVMFTAVTSSESLALGTSTVATAAMSGVYVGLAAAQAWLGGQ